VAAEIRSARRYYLLKRREAAARCDNLEQAWQAKQEAEPGAALPSDFPHIEQLQACGYTADVDLDGADADELVDLGLTTREAQAVLAALEDL